MGYKGDRYSFDEMRCGTRGYYDSFTEKCLSCPDHATFKEELGKCRCDGNYIYDVNNKKCIEQEYIRCSKDTDCVGKVPLTGNCADAYNLYIAKCIRHICELREEYCKYGCGKC